MMADMPAVSAQTPLQPGAAHGSSLVTPNTPIEMGQPVMQTPAADGRSSGEMASGGSSLTMGWVGMDLMQGVHNGGQVQGQRDNQAWPDRPSSSQIAQDAVGSQTDMDVRVINVPPPPHCSQSSGTGVGATEHSGPA